MTEARPRVTRRLAETASLAGFDPAKPIPNQLPLSGLIYLLAGTRKFKGRKSWESLVNGAIERGELAVIEETKTYLTTGNGGFASPKIWDDLARNRDTRQPKTIVAHRVTRHVTRPACAAWLASIGETRETLNPYVLEWLGEEWRDPTELDAKQAAIKSIIDEMRLHDPAIPQGDCPILPGILKGFHGLCIGKSKDFLQATSTFDKYRKGLCEFAQKGRPVESDLEYYKDMAKKMGVKWEAPAKSKPRNPPQS